MKSLRYQVLATAAALIAACAMTTTPAAFAGTTKEAAHPLLHLVIGDMVAGTDAMAGKTPKLKSQQGLVQVATAVNNYGRYFDDPGFNPIRVGH